jgi:hypothetical protein
VTLYAYRFTDLDKLRERVAELDRDVPVTGWLHARGTPHRVIVGEKADLDALPITNTTVQPYTGGEPTIDFRDWHPKYRDTSATPRTFVAAGLVQPGDLLVTRDRRIWAWLIRLGAALGDQPNTWNHVIIASHTDAAGTFWGIEARPGGVGWVDLAPWLASRWTIHNADQPKTAEQRVQIVAAASGLLGTPYDWQAIAADAMHAIGGSRLWRMRDWDGKPGVPAHVVCSSLATWIYMHVGLPEPVPPSQRARWRWTTPADWAAFILRHGWETT